MRNNKLPVLIPIISFLCGVFLTVLFCLVYINFTYERFENFWIPTISSNYFSSTQTNAAFFLNSGFSNGNECGEKEIETFLSAIEKPLADTVGKICKKFVLPNGTAYFINNGLNNDSLFFIANNGDKELLLSVNPKYPANDMWVKSSERGEIIILQEGYNNPAKTLYLQPK